MQPARALVGDDFFVPCSQCDRLFFARQYHHVKRDTSDFVAVSSLCLQCLTSNNSENNQGIRLENGHVLDTTVQYMDVVDPYFQRRPPPPREHVSKDPPDASDEPKYLVSAIGGSPQAITCGKGATVDDLMEAISKQHSTRMPKKEQRLLYLGRSLDSSAKLATSIPDSQTNRTLILIRVTPFKIAEIDRKAAETTQTFTITSYWVSEKPQHADLFLVACRRAPPTAPDAPPTVQFLAAANYAGVINEEGKAAKHELGFRVFESRQSAPASDHNPGWQSCDINFSRLLARLSTVQRLFLICKTDTLFKEVLIVLRRNIGHDKTETLASIPVVVDSKSAEPTGILLAFNRVDVGDKTIFELETLDRRVKEKLIVDGDDPQTIKKYLDDHIAADLSWPA